MIGVIRRIYIAVIETNKKFSIRSSSYGLDNVIGIIIIPSMAK
jgi:hypothetical protein